jgi:hypothetical protein
MKIVENKEIDKEIAKVVGLSASGSHKRLKELRVRLKEKGDVL